MSKTTVAEWEAQMEAWWVARAARARVKAREKAAMARLQVERLRKARMAAKDAAADAALADAKVAEWKARMAAKEGQP